MIWQARPKAARQHLESEGFAPLASQDEPVMAKPVVLSRLALAASVALHPLLLPSLWVWVASAFHLLPLGVRPGTEGWLVGFVWVSTFLLPMLGIALARQLGLMTGWLMQTRKDRLYAMFFTAGIYIGCAYMTARAIPGTVMVNRLLSTAAAVVVLTALINLFYRISAHTLASSAYVGFWLGIAFFASPSVHAKALLGSVEVAVLVAGIVAWARLYLNAHSPQQVLWGAVVGSVAGLGLAGWYMS